MAHLLSSPSGSFSMPVKVFSPASASNDEINEVERAILMAQGIQTLPPEGMSLKQHLVEVERSLIEQALARTQGNVSQTAKLLQLQRKSKHHLIAKVEKTPTLCMQNYRRSHITWLELFVQALS